MMVATSCRGIAIDEFARTIADIAQALESPKDADGSSSHAAKTRGLGLGLYIVERIVAAHGGTVSARSDAAEGTRFSVKLPRTA